MVGSIQPSHDLLAMGVPEGIAQATVRFSMGKDTTNADIAQTARALESIARRLSQ
jgi:cysteine desulfurase